MAKNVTYDQAALKASPGPVTITLDNQDSGVVHNLHLFQGTDANGTSVGQTDLTAGPVKETLTATLAPGTYHYQCDAHPGQMFGTLTAG